MKKYLVKIPLCIVIYYLLISFVAYALNLLKSSIGFYWPRIYHLYSWWWMNVGRGEPIVWSYEPIIHDWTSIIIASFIMVFVLVIMVRKEILQFIRHIKSKYKCKKDNSAKARINRLEQELEELKRNKSL